jgi:F-type H+-transporting ATPase subunit b
MQAFAADAAGHAAALPFYQAPEFWVALAFVILVVVAGRPIARMMAVALDDRAETIRNRLDEAARLREEAQKMLAEAQRRQRDAQKEAEEIVLRAKDEAQRLQARAVEDLELSVKRRQQGAMDRIAQAEARAIAEVRATATEVALAATQALLAETVTGAQADAMVDKAIAELPGKFN